jgi:peroxiredoxin
MKRTYFINSKNLHFENRPADSKKSYPGRIPQVSKILLSVGISFLLSFSAYSQGYKVGDKASDFKLKNVDGKLVSLKDFPEAKGFVVIFTCNHCPYAKAYQDRIINIDKNYKKSGYPVIAINSNDGIAEPQDSYAEMVVRAKDKGYTFPYLVDEDQSVLRAYGAQRTPHVFLLEKKGGDVYVKYIGAIDDNYEDPSKVTSPYLINAIKALLAGSNPTPDFTKAIGCGIKQKTSKT